MPTLRKLKTICPHIFFNVFLNGFDIYTDIKFAIDLFLLGHFQSVGRLHLALEHNTSADVIAVLIEGGADVRALDGDQRTPLHLAILKNCDAQVVGALLVPVAGNVESHELNEFLDFVERSRGQGQGLDRLETLLLLAVRNKASAWIVSSLINIGAHHYILLQGKTPPWWQR